MLTAPTQSQTPEELAFLQHRVARFGLFTAGLSLFFWLFRLLQGWYLDPALWLSNRSFGLHAVGWLFSLGIWAATVRGVRSYAFINTVESVGLVGACVAYITMALYVPLIARPEMIVLVALTLIMVGRAGYVPGTARRTLGLCVLIGVGYVWMTFRVYSSITPEHLALNPYLVSADEVAIGAAGTALIWWSMCAAMATGIAHVIFGLRREVRDVKKLGQYNLEEKLGEGGMGVVYRAKHGMLRRPTAIKLLHPDANGEAAVERFAREVRLTARLTHPNTVTIYDYGRTPEGVFYYAMELLDGAHLEDIVSVDGPQPAGRVVKVLSEVASALTEAHGVGLIHRDVKPANIVLSFRGGVPDVAKVVDFGLVKEIDREASTGLTHHNSITGTPLYMAPEAITDPDDVDARSDIYALGAVGYFLLTGTHVFSAKTVVEVCSHHLHTKPESPSTRLGAPVPAALEALILDCLRKDPADRPQTAADVVARIRRLDLLDAWGDDEAAEWWLSHRDALEARRSAPEALARTIEVEPRLLS